MTDKSNPKKEQRLHVKVRKEQFIKLWKMKVKTRKSIGQLVREALDKTYGKQVLVLLTVCSLSGCSAAMALSGKETKNISAIQVGQSRDVVVMNLGEPAKTNITETGRTDIFELQRGNDPSVGRALGHVGLDILTLGWWEIIGTPIEASQGKSFNLTVEYDREDNVVKVSSSDK